MLSHLAPSFWRHDQNPEETKQISSLKMFNTHCLLTRESWFFVIFHLAVLRCVSTGSALFPFFFFSITKVVRSIWYFFDITLVVEVWEFLDYKMHRDADCGAIKNLLDFSCCAQTECCTVTNPHEYMFQISSLDHHQHLSHKHFCDHWYTHTVATSWPLSRNSIVPQSVRISIIQSDDLDFMLRIIMWCESWLRLKPRDRTAVLAEESEQLTRSSKVLQVSSETRGMPAVFFDLHGFVHHAKYYFAVLRRLKENICCKWPELWRTGNWAINRDKLLAHSVLEMCKFVAHSNTVTTFSTSQIWLPVTSL